MHLGKYDITIGNEKGQQVFTTQEFKIHPNYDDYEITSDIAVVKLPKKAEFSDFVKPICLPMEDLGTLEGQDVIGIFLS